MPVSDLTYVQRALRESRGVVVPWLIAVVSLAVFQWNLDNPAYLFFDEGRYIPAARQILLQGVNENWSHPNFAKTLMAIGIAGFGDHPVGWRVMSAFFGVLAVLGAYGLGRVLFRSRMAGFQCALLALLNQLVFVQARIATLDIFSVGFLMPALALFARLWREPTALTQRARAVHLGGTGLLLGLAIAAKWIALVPLATCGALYVFKEKDGRVSRGLECATWLIPTAALAYALTLIPTLGMMHPSYAPPIPTPGGAPKAEATEPYGVARLIALQFEMFRTQLGYFNPHPYFSRWYTWPLQLRPIWYHREMWPEAGMQSGILLIGNPVVLWTGALAGLYCAWRSIRRRNPIAVFLFAIYLPLFAIWGVLPRAASLFYYYLPASLLLGPMLVFAARELGLGRKLQALYLSAVLASFVYFYPLLANVKLPTEAFKARVWFSSWW